MKKPTYRFAVATSDPDFHASFKQAVSGFEKPGTIVLNRTDPHEFFDAEVGDDLRRSEANILLLDVGGDDKGPIIQGLEALTAQLPDVRIVLAGHPTSAGELLDLMRAGVTDYLVKPIENGALEAALGRVTKGIVDPDIAGAKSGRVIGFIGPKGGTGVTTTVTNLALKLRALTGDSVLLADLNAELGTASILLGIRPRYNFVELVKNLHRMDGDLLASYVTKHETGMAFLPSPLTARDLEGVTKQRIHAAMALLRGQYEHVVLDLGNSMTPLAQAGLGVCDEVVVVLTPEVPALRNAKRLLPLISQAIPTGQNGLRFLVNRYDSKVDIPLSQIRDVLGHDVSATLPKVEDESVHAANVGRPLVLEGPGKYEKALHRLGIDVAAPGSVNGVVKRGAAGGLLDRLRAVRPTKAGKAKPGAKEARDVSEV